jgi:hypothetical protein
MKPPLGGDDVLVQEFAVDLLWLPPKRLWHIENFGSGCAAQADSPSLTGE